MTQEQFAPLSLNPETHLQGVGAVEGNQRVTEGRYVWDNYGGNKDKEGNPLPYRLALRLVLQADNGQVSEQLYSVSPDLEKFGISEDSTQIIPKKAGAAVHQSSNMSRLVRELQACGFPINKLGASSTDLENLYMTTEIVTVSRTGSDFGDSQMTLPKKIINMPWEPNLQPPVGSAPAQVIAATQAAASASGPPAAPPPQAAPPLAAPPATAPPIAAAAPPAQATAPAAAPPAQAAPPVAAAAAPQAAPVPTSPPPQAAPPVIPVLPMTSPPAGQTFVEKVQTIIRDMGAAKAQVFTKSDLVGVVFTGSYSADPERDVLSNFMLSPQFDAVATAMGYAINGETLTAAPTV